MHALLTVAACATEAPVPPQAQRLDLERPPQIVYSTLPFEVGATYTVGSVGVPVEVPGPVRVTGIEVLHASGVEVIGIGTYDGQDQRSGVGLVPGWPPELVTVPILDPRAGDAVIAGTANAVIGIRVTAPVSGLRGIRVSWVDGTGRAGSRLWDLAVITCAPGACSPADVESDAVLRDLGLIR